MLLERQVDKEDVQPSSTTHKSTPSSHPSQPPQPQNSFADTCSRHLRLTFRARQPRAATQFRRGAARRANGELAVRLNVYAPCARQLICGVRGCASVGMSLSRVGGWAVAAMGRVGRDAVVDAIPLPVFTTWRSFEQRLLTLNRPQRCVLQYSSVLVQATSSIAVVSLEEQPSSFDWSAASSRGPFIVTSSKHHIDSWRQPVSNWN